MYVLIATTALILLTLYGPLPSASSPGATAAFYGGLYLLFGCVRLGLGRWHRGTSKARFVKELGGGALHWNEEGRQVPTDLSILPSVDETENELDAEPVL